MPPYFVWQRRAELHAEIHWSDLLLVSQLPLNLEEIFGHLFNIDSLRPQLAMCNLITKSIITHDPRPRAAPARILIKHKSRTILESQAGQSILIWIVQVPGS